MLEPLRANSVERAAGGGAIDRAGTEARAGAGVPEATALPWCSRGPRRYRFFPRLFELRGRFAGSRQNSRWLGAMPARHSYLRSGVRRHRRRWKNCDRA